MFAKIASKKVKNNTKNDWQSNAIYATISIVNFEKDAIKKTGVHWKINNKQYPLEFKPSGSFL